jgi:hypothetical protein
MAEMLRAKADALAARATVARLEGKLSAMRSRPWWRWLVRREKQPNPASAVSASIHADVWDGHQAAMPQQDSVDLLGFG